MGFASNFSFIGVAVLIARSRPVRHVRSRAVLSAGASCCATRDCTPGGSSKNIVGLASPKSRPLRVDTLGK